MSDKITSALESHETAIVSGLKTMGDHWKEILGHVQVVKSQELWRSKYKTYTEFLDKVGEKSGITPRRIYELLRAQEVKIKLLNSVPKNSQNLSKTVEKMKPEAFLEIAKKPPDERIEIVRNIVEKGETPTVPTIAAMTSVVQASKSKPRDSKEKSTWPNDDTPNGGTPIPPPAWEYWDRRNYVQPWLTQISGIKCSIEKALKDGDALFAWIGNPAIDFLSSSYAAISNAKLYAVCTDCQGWAEKKGGCQTCHNTGLISKHQYEVCSKREVKDMRERAKGLRL